MEMSRSKRLGRHALPVIMIMAVMTLVSVVALSSHDNALGALGRGLVSRVIHITPSTNGWAEVSLEKPQPVMTTGLSSATEAGRKAQLSFSLSQTENQ